MNNPSCENCKKDCILKHIWEDSNPPCLLYVYNPEKDINKESENKETSNGQDSCYK